MRRLIMICTFGALAGLLIISANPLNNTMLRLALLICLAVAWLGFLIIVWKLKPVRIITLLLPLLTAFPFLLPGGEINAEELHQDYVLRMTQYEGTKYYWGGESPRGIDCSGLPRRALRDALIAYAIRHRSGDALCKYFEQWWFDASAKALGEGYRHYTQEIGTIETIQTMDYEKLISGDLAVTTNGLHILAYVGKGQWIQADPDIGYVVILSGRENDNYWFKAPVTTHRWTFFSALR